MQTYTLTFGCETCGQDMKNTIGDLSVGPDDPIVIDIDLAVSQSTFSCDHCGGQTYFGDLDDMVEHEPGTEPEDGDDDE